MPTAKDFLDALWPTSGHGMLRVFPRDASEQPSEDRFFEWSGKADDLVSALEDPDGIAFIGQGVRSEPSPGRDKVSAINAAWLSVNLNCVPSHRAIERLKSFKLRPSVGLSVDGMLHVFWFFKHPLVGKDVDGIWGLNQRLKRTLFLGSPEAYWDPVLIREGIQSSHYDFDGLIRAPGQPGASFVAWHPELRYGAEDFKGALSGPNPGIGLPIQIPEDPPGPTKRVDEDRLAKICKSFSSVWVDQLPTATHVAGMFARARIIIEQAKDFVETAVKKVNGEVETRVRQVESTYRRHFEEGVEEITGYKALLKLIEKSYPPDSQKKAEKAATDLYGLLPQRETPEEAANAGQFCISKIIKFDSRPARWSITLSFQDGTEATACVETMVLGMYTQFQMAFWEETHTLPPEISQNVWKRKLREAKSMIEVKETPQEAKPQGAIERAIEEFLADAKESPDVGLLRAFPGYDADSRYFRYRAFKDFLKETGSRVEDRVIFEHLKHIGFENTVKRFGTKTQRVWLQEFKGSGNGQPEGSPEGAPTPTPAPSKEFDLFSEEAPSVSGEASAVKGEGEGT